jgi:hypothetical protein
MINSRPVQQVGYSGLTYTILISAEDISAVGVERPPDAMEVDEATARLAGRGGTGPLATLGIDRTSDVEGPFLPAMRATLGGTYSLGVSEVAGGKAIAALARAATSFRTDSAIPLRTFLLLSSFLRSARAPSVTAGPVKSSMTDCFAQSRTLASLSSNAPMRWGRYGRIGKR